MKVEFVNPFLEAAIRVLEAEVKTKITVGELSLQSGAYTTQEVTVVVAVTGKVQGFVLYGMAEATALSILAAEMGDYSCSKLDDLAQSGVAELGNVITGTASTLLADNGYLSTVSPPSIMIGKGLQFSTLDIRRLVVRMVTEFGPIEMHVALRSTVG